jgi:CheY-like chemotaxis protein
VSQSPFRGLLNRLGVARKPASPAAPTALIVEDDPAMVRIFSTLLGSAGWAPLSAHDGDQGLALARKHSPGLILLDLHMPGGGGMKLLTRCRAEPALRQTPIIVITADRKSGVAERARAQGATAFVQKPVEPDQLISLLRTYLPQSQ